jgi:hypothetical protein
MGAKPLGCLFISIIAVFIRFFALVEKGGSMDCAVKEWPFPPPFYLPSPPLLPPQQVLAGSPIQPGIESGLHLHYA